LKKRKTKGYSRTLWTPTTGNLKVKTKAMDLELARNDKNDLILD
jgi:hypothetical protein